MPKTVTETQKELQEVEKEFYLCDNCEQKIDEETITVAIDPYEEDGERSLVRRGALCSTCADALFGYSRPRTDIGRKYLDPVMWNAPDGFFAKVGYYTTLTIVSVTVAIIFVLMPFP